MGSNNIIKSLSNQFLFWDEMTTFSRYFLILTFTLLFLNYDNINYWGLFIANILLNLYSFKNMKIIVKEIALEKIKILEENKEV